MLWEACGVDLFVAAAVGADIFIDIEDIDIWENASCSSLAACSVAVQHTREQ